MLVWIVALVGSIALGVGEAEPVEGTWKIREPLHFEVEGEVCAVRRGVAYLSQTGTTLSGKYEAEFACWSPYAPQVEWGPRHGQLLGRIDGDDFTAQLFVGDPFPIRLEGTFTDQVISGTFHLGDYASGVWSAAKLPAGPPVSD